MPVFYECQRCAACCRWPGQVRLTTGEITRLAAFQGLSEPEFIQQFTRLTADRRGLALLDQPDGACIFLKDGQCAVQSVKPQQCRDFPHLWRNPDTVSFCRAMPREVDPEEYVRLLAAATGRSEVAVSRLVRSQIAGGAGAA
ncbi:MAG TPA: YkgJ family cysteine cluster protein [Dongiaceae bacterium]|nr:YkgJ family cysteine cluster protein [Dongiaceae bacterium]